MLHRRYNEKETEEVAQDLLPLIAPQREGATVVGLSGELGAGKTTLAQSLARALGVTEVVQSPTFVIAKFYEPTKGGFSKIVHIDAYRIEKIEELVPLGWRELIAMPETLILVEWPQRIQAALPENVHHFTLVHDGGERTITYGA